MWSWRSKAKGLILLVAFFGLAESAIAKQVHIPVVRDADGIPVPCIQDPNCHNRFHPDIPPVAFANPGDIVIFETRDAFEENVAAAQKTHD